jgi:hypothetical protein
MSEQHSIFSSTKMFPFFTPILKDWRVEEKGSWSILWPCTIFIQTKVWQIYRWKVINKKDWGKYVSNHYLIIVHLCNLCFTCESSFVKVKSKLNLERLPNAVTGTQRVGVHGIGVTKPGWSQTTWDWISALLLTNVWGLILCGLKWLS